MSNEPIVLGDYMGMASVSIEGNNPLFCHICHVKLNSKEQAEFHYRGIRHIKKARVARMAEGESRTHRMIGVERPATRMAEGESHTHKTIGFECPATRMAEGGSDTQEMIGFEHPATHSHG